MSLLVHYTDFINYTSFRPRLVVSQEPDLLSEKNAIF